MSFVSKFLIAASAAAPLIAHVEKAAACTAPYPGVLSRLVLPNGDEDVALDARIIIHLDTQNLRGGMDPIDTATFVERAGFFVKTSTGEPVEAEVRYFGTDGSVTVFLEPKSGLVANTEYVVYDKVVVSGGSGMQWTVPFLDEAVEVGRFETGVRAAGDSSPDMGSVTTSESGQSCANDACCGPYEAVAMSLGFDAPELGLLARIEREVDGEFEAVAWVNGGYASGWAACLGGWSPSPDFKGGGTYRVRYEGPSPALGAPSEAVTLTGQCGEEEPEGPIGEPNPPVEEGPGPEANPDSGARTDEPDSGCAGGGAGALGWLGLGLFGLWRRRTAAR